MLHDKIVSAAMDAMKNELAKWGISYGELYKQLLETSAVVLTTSADDKNKLASFITSHEKPDVTFMTPQFARALDTAYDIGHKDNELELMQAILNDELAEQGKPPHALPISDLEKKFSKTPNINWSRGCARGLYRAWIHTKA